ncbi:MAG: hypothetical protein GY778_17385 [bacterium]|nr:hypothetical protein [bacterium]
MVLTLCVVVACSSPSDYFPISCLAYFIIGPGVVLGLLVDWVRCLSSVSYSGGSVDAPPSVTKRRRWAWAATPVALLLIVSALASPWPTWVRFAMSESAFERAITDRSDDSGGLVGFYSVSRINRYKNGAIFFKTGPAFMDEAGFAYLPKGELPEHAELYVGQELAPGWYVANLSW